jgi:hypothetical protein
VTEGTLRERWDNAFGTVISVSKEVLLAEQQEMSEQITGFEAREHGQSRT